MSPSLILSHPAYHSLYKTPHMYAISSVRISILHTSVLQRTCQCRHRPLLALLVVRYDSGRRRLPVLGPSSTPQNSAVSNKETRVECGAAHELKPLLLRRTVIRSSELRRFGRICA